MNNQVPQNVMKENENKTNYLSSNYGYMGQLNYPNVNNSYLNQNTNMIYPEYQNYNSFYSNGNYQMSYYPNQMMNNPYKSLSYNNFNQFNQFNPYNQMNQLNGFNENNFNNDKHFYDNNNKNSNLNDIDLKKFENIKLNSENIEENDVLITKCNITNINIYLQEFLNVNIKGSNNRYAIIKSIDDDNILKSYKNSLWTSTQKGNAKLNSLFSESDGNVYLFFSVNKSGKFCSIAKMASVADTNNLSSNKDKWKGYFKIKWLVIKDVPNHVFKNVLNEYNEKKSVVFSRDSQEVDKASGKSMMKLFLDFPYMGSIIDDSFFKDQNQIIPTTFTENMIETYNKSMILSYKS